MLNTHPSFILQAASALFHLTHEELAAQGPSGLPKVTEVTARSQSGSQDWNLDPLAPEPGSHLPAVSLWFHFYCELINLPPIIVCGV